MSDWADAGLDEQEELLLRWNLAIARQRGVQLRGPGTDPTLNELILHSKIRGNQRLQIFGSDKLRVASCAENFLELTIPKKIVIEPGVCEAAEVYDRISGEFGRNFILKTNHDSGSVRFISSYPSFKEALIYLERARRRVYGLSTAETSYFAVGRNIFAEENVTQDSSAAMDVKCHCFEGEIFLFQIIFDRYQKSATKEVLLDGNFGEVDGLLDSNFQSARLSAVPQLLDKLGRNVLEDVRSVAAEFGGYVRIDLLAGGGGLSLGETTFFPYGGFYPDHLLSKSLNVLAGQALLDWSAKRSDIAKVPKLTPRELLIMGHQNSERLGLPGKINFEFAQYFLKSIGL